MPTALSSKKPVRLVGDYVSREYFQQLIGGYAQMHPTEEKSVFIRREYMVATLAESPRVCGIRFMYGLREGDDPRSRTVLLMSCYETVGSSVPKLLFTKKGHLSHAGQRYSTSQCCAMLDRHIDRLCARSPSVSRMDMPRSCFFGSAILEDLLGRKDCAGVRFHFGYDPACGQPGERYGVVLEGVDGEDGSLNLFVDHGGLCPPNCPPMPPIPPM